MNRFIFYTPVLLLAMSMTTVAQPTNKNTDAKLISAPKFQISAEDEAAGIGGKIKLAVDVDETGSVKRAVVFVGPEWPCDEGLSGRVTSVMRNAEEAVRRFKFSPAVKDGKPVASRLALSIAIGKTAASPDPKPANTAKPDRIEGGVINGKAKYLAKPPYPAEARSERASGTVSVRVLIGEDGKVLSAQSTDGHALLQFAARAAACESKFEPTTLSGQRVKVSGVITYNFKP